MPYVNEDFATESLAVDANIVIIMLGTNDSKPDNWNAEQYEKEYIAFVQNYQNIASAPEVYLMLPPRVFAEPENTGDCNNTVLTEEVIPAIERVATQTDAKIIDLYSVTKEHADWYSDGLHPNADGNKAIAQAIYEQLTAN
jgi:alpha-L-fucosidase 2